MPAPATPMPRNSHSEPGLRLAAQSGLDVMLTDAVLEGGGMSRFLKPRAAGRTIAGLARHPRRAPRDSAGFGVELARAAARAGDLKPAPKTLGRKHKATAKAPGNYVHAS